MAAASELDLGWTDEVPVLKNNQIHRVYLWRSRLESNQYLALRRGSFCPLNYGNGAAHCNNLRVRVKTCNDLVFVCRHLASLFL